MPENQMPDHDITVQKTSTETIISVKGRSALRNVIAEKAMPVGIFASGIPIVLGFFIMVMSSFWIGLGFVVLGALVLGGLMWVLNWSFEKNVEQTVKVSDQGIEHKDRLYLFQDVEALYHNFTNFEVATSGTGV